MYDLTFLIPTRIETDDRLRNIISSVSYLLKHVPAKIIVKETSSSSIFQLQALPEIQKRVDTSNLTYVYEEDSSALFCKSKVLNDLLSMADTKVVANYDADCILPISSYQLAYAAIKNNSVDIVYPYQCGIYQWQAEYNEKIYNQFMNELDVSVLDQNKKLSNSTIGWCQFINRKKYIDSYMMNENFISWGCEDDEFYFRMSTLGNRIGRIDNYVYHLEHSRTHNSWFSNPNFNHNWSLWNQIKTFDKTQLMRYYESLDYVKTRKNELV